MCLHGLYVLGASSSEPSPPGAPTVLLSWESPPSGDTSTASLDGTRGDGSDRDGSPGPRNRTHRVEFGWSSHRRGAVVLSYNRDTTKTGSDVVSSTPSSLNP